MGILSDENAMCDEHYRNDNCDQCPINKVIAGSAEDRKQNSVTDA